MIVCNLVRKESEYNHELYDIRCKIHYDFKKRYGYRYSKEELKDKLKYFLERLKQNCKDVEEARKELNELEKMCFHIDTIEHRCLSNIKKHLDVLYREQSSLIDMIDILEDSINDNMFISKIRNDNNIKVIRIKDSKELESFLSSLS